MRSGEFPDTGQSSGGKECGAVGDGVFCGWNGCKWFGCEVAHALAKCADRGGQYLAAVSVSGPVDMITALLDAGVDVNSPDDAKETALMTAMRICCCRQGRRNVFSNTLRSG
jgi:hypothetical protein